VHEQNAVRSLWLTAIALALLAGAMHPPFARAQASSPVPAGAPHTARSRTDPDLDAALRLQYELKFDAARARLAAWQRHHPGEPLGPALEAASDLFEEFYRKGVFTSEFFLDDRRFLGGIDGKPDARLESAFVSAAQNAEEEARRWLADRPGDPDALFALTLIAGMRADNASLIEKRQLESLGYLREADHDARELLARAPDDGDAYMALGATNYIIGSLPGYKRFFLRFGGVHGDKSKGMEQLSEAAMSGHYLRPYAKLMLALAALREMQPALARREFQQLVAEFPANPLFANELRKLQPNVSPADP
jgi:hypothetical protein